MAVGRGSGTPQVCSRRTIQQEINFHGFHDLQPSGPCAASSLARLRRSRPIREGDRAAKAISSWCNRFHPCSIHFNPGHVARPSLPTHPSSPQPDKDARVKPLETTPPFPICRPSRTPPFPRSSCVYPQTAGRCRTTPEELNNSTLNCVSEACVTWRDASLPAISDFDIVILGGLSRSDSQRPNPKGTQGPAEERPPPLDRRRHGKRPGSCSCVFDCFSFCEIPIELSLPVPGAA